jgi:hypothetical protein
MNPFNKGLVLSALDKASKSVNSYYERVKEIQVEKDYSAHVVNPYLSTFRTQLNQVENLKSYVRSTESEITVNLTQEQFTLIQNYYLR